MALPPTLICTIGLTRAPPAGEQGASFHDCTGGLTLEGSATGVWGKGGGFGQWPPPSGTLAVGACYWLGQHPQAVAPSRAAQRGLWVSNAGVGTDLGG